ncbi:Mcm10 domain-containing protein, partial [Haematococcus lacustris]
METPCTLELVSSKHKTFPAAYWVVAEGKTGSMYSRWQLSDLAGTSITLFLFGQAHKELYKESEGSVVIVRAAKLKREERGPGQVSMSVEQPEQVQRIGHSPDFGFCLGKKQDGGRCSAVVNRSQCEFCVHHAKTALRQLQAKRPELSGAGRSLFERQLVPIVNKAEAQRRARAQAGRAHPSLHGQQLADTAQQLLVARGAGGKRTRGLDAVLAVAQQDEDQ